MFKIKEVLNQENKNLFIRYALISVLSYGFVFTGLIVLVELFNINKTIAFIIVYAINYLFLYLVQLKYLFKTRHKFTKLLRFIGFVLFFYIIANIIYNTGLKLGLNYLLSTALTIIILMPFRVIISKLVVFKT